MMPNIMNIIYGIIAAYIIGSFPTGYLVGRLRGVDVLAQGSGSVGATNVLRSAGKLPALIALTIDIAKGIIAVTVLANFFYFKRDVPLDYDVFRSLLGISAIAGHNWSIFLKFKGGKGVATSLGILAVLLPKETAVAAAVWVITVAATKYISLGSILLAITVPIVSAIMGEDIELTLFAVTICILISYRHKSNIKRLLVGIENKIGNVES